MHWSSRMLCPTLDCASAVLGICGSVQISFWGGILSALLSRDIDGNRLTSSLPTELGALTRLTYLWLHHNQLSGAIPSELGAVTSLMYMRVHNNAGLCGDIPVGLSLSAGTSNTRLGSACLSLAPSGAHFGTCCML